MLATSVRLKPGNYVWKVGTNPATALPAGTLPGAVVPVSPNRYLRSKWRCAYRRYPAANVGRIILNQQHAGGVSGYCLLPFCLCLRVAATKLGTMWVAGHAPSRIRQHRGALKKSTEPYWDLLRHPNGYLISECLAHAIKLGRELLDMRLRRGDRSRSSALLQGLTQLRQAQGAKAGATRF